MNTIKTENGISLLWNGKTTWMVVAKQEVGTTDVIYGATDTLRKANGIFNRILSNMK